MLGELLVVDVDARRLRGAPQTRLVEGRLEGAERARERRDAHVDDGEADRGVGRVERPGPLGTPVVSIVLLTSFLPVITHYLREE